MTTKQLTKKPVAPIKRLGRCQFFSGDDRRCRMPRWHAHPVYCLHHARHEQQLLETERVASELTSLTGTFKTANDVNHALGNLFSAVSQNRIPPRNAAILAYTGALLLHSLPRVAREVNDAFGFQAWDRKLRELFGVTPVPSPAPRTPPAPPSPSQTQSNQQMCAEPSRDAREITPASRAE
jgi:hypothetical protein